MPTDPLADWSDYRKAMNGIPVPSDVGGSISYRRGYADGVAAERAWWRQIIAEHAWCQECAIAQDERVTDRLRGGS